MDWRYRLRTIVVVVAGILISCILLVSFIYWINLEPVESPPLYVTSKIVIMENATSTYPCSYEITGYLYNNEDLVLHVSYKNFFLRYHNGTGIPPNYPLFLNDSYAVVSPGDSNLFHIRFFLEDPDILPYQLNYRYLDIEYSIDMDDQGEAYPENGICCTMSCLSIVVIMMAAGIFYFVYNPRMLTWIKNKPADDLCPICQIKVEKGTGIMCESWRTKTRRCESGPYCSKKCLKKHHENTYHEHWLGD